MSLKKILFISFLIIVVVGFGLFFSTSVRREKGGGQLETGRPLPDFELPNREGRPIRLSDFRGKVVFLNIWATWCPPCVQEMPSIEWLHRELSKKPFTVLAVSQDAGDGEKVWRFARQRELTFSIIHDPQQQLTRLYEVTGYPETLIVDKEGILVERIIGAREWNSSQWVAALSQLADR